jgi:hypothetical protein
MCKSRGPGTGELQWFNLCLHAGGWGLGAGGLHGCRLCFSSMCSLLVSQAVFLKLCFSSCVSQMCAACVSSCVSQAVFLKCVQLVPQAVFLKQCSSSSVPQAVFLKLCSSSCVPQACAEGGCACLTNKQRQGLGAHSWCLALASRLPTHPNNQGCRINIRDPRSKIQDISSLHWFP